MTVHTLSAADRAMGRAVIRLLAKIRDGRVAAVADDDQPFGDVLGVAVHAGLATIAYDLVRHGGEGVVLSLTEEGMKVLCLAENGHVALRS